MSSGAGLPGLRRLGWVRVVVEPGHCRAEAVGLRHRLPAVVPLSLRMASDLAREGVPVVVHRRPPDGTGA